LTSSRFSDDLSTGSKASGRRAVLPNPAGLWTVEALAAAVPPRQIRQGKEKPFMESAAFRSHRITRGYRQTIHASAETVFPLLCPVREAEWLDGWQYEMIYSESGLVEEGAVFSTPSEAEEDTVWIVVKHDSSTREVEFARFTNNSRTCLLKIAVKPKGEHSSYVDISYTYTGITSAGNRFVDDFGEDVFLEAVTFWEDSMNYFLETAKRLRKT
jgi:hypothetical protein